MDTTIEDVKVVVVDVAVAANPPSLDYSKARNGTALQPLPAFIAAERRCILETIWPVLERVASMPMVLSRLITEFVFGGVSFDVGIHARILGSNHIYRLNPFTSAWCKQTSPHNEKWLSIGHDLLVMDGGEIGNTDSIQQEKSILSISTFGLACFKYGSRDTEKECGHGSHLRTSPLCSPSAQCYKWNEGLLCIDDNNDGQLSAVYLSVPKLPLPDLTELTTVIEWKSTLSMHFDRHGCAVASLRNGFYLFGGIETTWHSFKPAVAATTNGRDVYLDAFTREWAVVPTRTPNLVTSSWSTLYSTAVAISETKCWIMGGRTRRCDLVDSVYEFDSETNVLTELKWTLPRPIQSCVAYFDEPSESLCIAGGLVSDGGWNHLVDSALAYVRDRNGKWYTLPPLTAVDKTHTAFSLRC